MSIPLKFTMVRRSLQWSGGLRVVRLPARSWHGLPCWYEIYLIVATIWMCAAVSSLRVFWENVRPFTPRLLFLKVKISTRTLIPLFAPGSVHSGLVSWDDTLGCVNRCLIERADSVHVGKKYSEKRSLCLRFRNVDPEKLFDFLKKIGHHRHHLCINREGHWGTIDD